MNSVAKALIAAFIAAPSVSTAQDVEAIVIANQDRNGSNFYMLSLRTGLAFAGAQAADGNERNAATGLRFRFDATLSEYDTNYNAVSGTGTNRGYKALLAYGFALSEDVTLTLIGGISHREREVRPVTPSSPDDSSETGGFIGAEFEYSPEGAGVLQLIAEHDAVGATYASASYAFDLGQNFRVGPTANYVEEGDYSRQAYGLSATYFMGDRFEVKATAANAEQQVGGNDPVDVDYFELQLRSVF